MLDSPSAGFVRVQSRRADNSAFVYAERRVGNLKLYLLRKEYRRWEKVSITSSLKALAWTLASGPLTIVPIMVGSVAHTSAVNRRIEAHFESLSFTESLLKPNQIATGFFYFKLPSGIERLENLRVEVTSTEEQTGSQLSYKFTLPTLNLR